MDNQSMERSERTEWIGEFLILKGRVGLVFEDEVAWISGGYGTFGADRGKRDVR